MPSQDAHLVWQGTSTSHQFFLTISESEKPRNVVGVLSIAVNNVPIGDIKFKLEIVGERFTDVAAEPTGEARRFQHAFISYASADRYEVLSRVQMLRAAGIAFFQDVLDLDPGERWERELYCKIDESDVMFLFWSTHAKKSRWVEKEWRYGLRRKGDDFIYPVIIEGPPIPKPPEELEHLHFNDKVLHLIKTTKTGMRSRWLEKIAFWKRRN